METHKLSAVLEESIHSLLNKIGREFKQVLFNRLLEYQIEEYRRNYFCKTILHRVEPKPLLEFYQPLFLYTGEDRTKKISTSSIKELLDKHHYITIIGSAGSGKSTIIKYLFVNCFKERYKIPIKIELRYLNEFTGSFNDYIFNEIFRFQKLGFSGDIIDRLLSSDRFVFFLDGYDELNSSIRAVTTKNIDAFIQKYSRNEYVITSRPHTNIDLLPLFTNFYVCDLNPDEIKAFVKKQIPISESELAEKIINAIFKHENRSYRPFLRNPLLLSMFILTFQSYSDIPKRRSEFYKQVFDTLFSIHDSISKLSYVREKQSGLSKGQFEDILSLFSFLSFFEEKFLFPSNYLSDKLNIIKTKKKNFTFDNDKFIEDLQIAIGILNKDGIDYTFPHRSLQEYFAATYIKKLSDENKKLLYKKIRTELEQGFGRLLVREHFLGLLAEMDYSSLSLNLAIPITESVLERLQEQPRITNQVAYESYGKLFLIFGILIQAPQFPQQAYKQVIDKRIKFVPFLEVREKNIFSIASHMPSGLQKVINFPLLKKIIENFKENGLSVIDMLRQSIEESERSDSEIISLI